MRRLLLGVLGAVLLASVTVALAETKETPKPPVAPALTAEQKATLQQMKDLHKRLRIARLELALAEAKEAPEREIAGKAEDMYRLQGEMHAFRAKHPEVGRLTRHARGQGGEQGMGPGCGCGGRGGEMGMSRRGMGGHGRGMGRHMSPGAGQCCPFAEKGMGADCCPGVGPERGGMMGSGQGRGMGHGDKREMRGMGPRSRDQVAPAPNAPKGPEDESAPEEQSVK